MVRLPVSGNEVALRAPDGKDDILLQEASGGPVEVGIALLGRLGGANDWAGLSVTDFEFLLLHLRAQRFGEYLSLGFACPECGERVEVGFRIADYLRSVQPRAVPSVTRDPDRVGWFRLGGAGFRLPTAGDQAAVASLANPVRHLEERCLDVMARQDRKSVV